MNAQMNVTTESTGATEHVSPSQQPQQLQDRRTQGPAQARAGQFPHGVPQSSPEGPVTQRPSVDPHILRQAVNEAIARQTALQETMQEQYLFPQDPTFIPDDDAGYIPMEEYLHEFMDRYGRRHRRAGYERTH